MKYWILILSATLLLITSSEIRAHNLLGVYGNTQVHQHVYRRQEYGKPLQQGHLVQIPGGQRMISWGLSAGSDYGKSGARRRGPIIGDHYPKPRAMPKVSNKYGSAVNGYGKAVNGYGKSGRGK